MKKKIFTILLVATLVFAGCGNSNTNNKSDATKKEEIKKDVDDMKEAESKDESTTSKEEGNSKDGKSEERSLADLEQYMLEMGCLTGERIEKAFEMLGAVDGFGYDCGVEIYQYDTNSDTYVSVAAGEEIPLQGMDGYSIKFNAVNGEFAILVSDETNLQAIVDAFNAYQ